MIFVTVGDQLPFDRLIRTMDLWVSETGYRKVFAQVGNASYLPQNIDYCQFCSPSEYHERISGAELVIGHAGIGTILSAMEYKKAVLVMPRQVALSEVTNEHQIVTAKHFLRKQFVEVAFDEVELLEKMQNISTIIMRKRALCNSFASSELLQTLRDFVSD